MKKMALIGYSGHAFVVEEVLNSKGVEVFGYFEKHIKKDISLVYLGDENEAQAIQWLTKNDFVVAIGDNKVRSKIYTNVLSHVDYTPSSAIHSSALISKKASLGSYVQVITSAIIHPYAVIGNGSIINTASVVEHECVVGEFCHISCGAVLCGNVSIGDFTFIGANTVVRQGIKIGKNVIVGAGSVVVSDVPDNSVVMGNPAK